MSNKRKPSFTQLVTQNRKQILSDPALLDQIETKIELRHQQKLKSVQ
ncbi:FbpB family small basic protein [Thalassobacillus hwangdonensis]|uniref:FbpB family small basic protein n=1 Tax=Thalassobacillus hwangdonensis TaxID=546108 RepID=A0ABW3L143_9BACI